MDQNIYRAPESDVMGEQNGHSQLASRWDRLWASLLDGLIVTLITLPVMYFTGGFAVFSGGEPVSIGYSLFYALLGIIVFLLINGSSLKQNGQTVGKKILGIKIVDLNGELPSWKNHLLKRYAVYILPGHVPLIGPLFSFVNILFIFGREKRCIHDLAGGTKVVSV